MIITIAVVIGGFTYYYFVYDNDNKKDDGTPNCGTGNFKTGNN